MCVFTIEIWESIHNTLFSLTKLECFSLASLSSISQCNTPAQWAHLYVWPYVTLSSFIEGSHMTKNTASWFHLQVFASQDTVSYCQLNIFSHLGGILSSSSRCQCNKRFTLVIYEWVEKACLLVPGKPFQPSLTEIPGLTHNRQTPAYCSTVTIKAVKILQYKHQEAFNSVKHNLLLL